MASQTKKVAILVEHHYQDMEIWVPYYRLKEAGLDVKLIGSGSADLYFGKYGYPCKVDGNAAELNHKDYDAVIVPGGWAPDFLRRHEPVLRFVRSMSESGKIVAAICHAGWVLASAQILKGRTVTAFSAIKDDVINAGATYKDQAVVVDKNLITSRSPDDLPFFCMEILKALKIS